MASHLRKLFAFLFCLAISYLIMNKTKEGQLHSLLSLPMESFHIYGLIFSLMLISYSFLRRAGLIASSTQLESSFEDKHRLLNSQLHVLLVFINVCAILYARRQHEDLCEPKRIACLSFWVLLGRFLDIIGQILNSKYKKEGLQIFGETFKAMATAISCALALGYDLFIFL